MEEFPQHLRSNRLNPRMDEKRWRTTIIFWSTLFILAGLTFLYNLAEVKTIANTTNFIITPHSTPPEKSHQLTPPYTADEPTTKGYLIKTPGCTIPDLNPMDPLIKKFIFREHSVVCNKGLPPLFECNRSAVYLVDEALANYEIHDASKLTCCYQYFRRANPGADQADKHVVYDEKCQTIPGNSTFISPDEEFMRIKCQYNSNAIYKDFFTFIPVHSENISKKPEESEKPKLNLLVIGIDAVSRLNFHRQMPKTAFYLEKLNAIEFLGYNKIGDNTYPNLIAALTGHDEKEIQKSCWPKEDAYFDECAFIWKNFKQSGYTTAFGEDAAWMGLFYYTKRGFRRKPTDYFYDHFDITATNEIGNNHRLNVDQCLGSRQAYQVFLDYISNFALAMADSARPFFGFFWSSSLSHDYLNKPKLGDQDYMNLLFGLDEEGILNKTALIVLSDHGIRWGSIRSTYQGRMEERLPFLYLALPQWYREMYPEVDHNLKVNVRRLTTPFDLYETFLDVLHPEIDQKEEKHNLEKQKQEKQKQEKQNEEKHKEKEENLKRGISLFRTIPKNRTCKTAGIAQHWCTCQNSVNIDTTSEVVIEAVNHTVQYINNLLIGYADCMSLQIASIEDARELTNDNEMKDYTRSIRDFTVTFKTEPGGAIFEATVRREENEQRDVLGELTAKYSITGTVSRINLYGEQSRCMTEFHLKLYCYCRSYFGT